MARKLIEATDAYVGKRIRSRRLMIRMSQTNLGDALGITFQQVQKYEKGTNRVSASRLQSMANILGVPVAFFFEGGPLANGHGRAPQSAEAAFADVLATRDGIALCTAFRRLDAKLRRSVVALIESMAEGKRTGGKAAA